MIIIHEGIPGSGKSYDAVKKISDNLRFGRCVYTNIEGLDDDRHKEALKFVSGCDDFQFNKLFHHLTVEESKHFWEFAEPGSLIIIDEVHKLFNSRDWQSERNRKLGDWASTHRHQGYDCIFMTQKIEKLDMQVRTLAEWTYKYIKINFLGSLVTKGYICVAFAGDDTGSQPLSRQTRRYDKKYFACYKSYASKDIKELNIQKHANILKRPIFFLIPVVLAITIFFAMRSGFATGNLFGYKDIMKNTGIQKISDTTKQAIPAMPVELKKEFGLQKNSVKTMIIEKKSDQDPDGNKKAPPGGTDFKEFTKTKRIDQGDQDGKMSNQKGKLIAVIDGKKVFSCGKSICE